VLWDAGKLGADLRSAPDYLPRTRRAGTRGVIDGFRAAGKGVYDHADDHSPGHGDQREH
jgi:hypothetical protein